MAEYNLGIFCVVLLFFILVDGVISSDPIVNTDLGAIRGRLSQNGDYSMFLGIPYASVNTSNPFGPSIPQTRFADTFNAFDGSAICPQRDLFTTEPIGSLDCLHLSVYVPNTATPSNRRPVMVWIPGGAFTSGSYTAEFGPSFLINHDIVLVAINYRVGVYGFMCLNIPEVSGNQGLKDQLTALRWIKSNIEAFGGDSDKITIYGQSAGSISIDYHYIFNQENLFDKIILQSGTSLSTFGIADPDVDYPMKIVERLGAITNNVNQALAILNTLDPNAVLSASTSLPDVLPCVEQEFENVERFITDYPINIRQNRNIPILIGINEEEGVSMLRSNILNPTLLEAQNTIFYDGLRESFDFDNDQLRRMAENVRAFYIGGRNIDANILPEVLYFRSDITFNHPAYTTIRKYLSSENQNIYFYKFSYKGNRNRFEIIYNITGFAATHGDELGYLFDGTFTDEAPTPEDQLVIDRITMLWTNFAKYGNPTPESTDLIPFVWPAVTQDSLTFLNIDLELELDSWPFRSRMAYWDIFFEINEMYLIGYREE